jgi:hypothetical protein
MRRAGLQYDVVVWSTANAIGAFLQPLQPDQAEPTFGRSESRESSCTPFLDALLVGIGRVRLFRGIGMHEGDSTTQYQSGEDITPHGVDSARCKEIQYGRLIRSYTSAA